MKTNYSEFRAKDHQAKKKTSTRCKSHHGENWIPQRTSDITNILIRIKKKKKKKGNAKEYSNCCSLVLISHASKAVFKILQARLQQYVDQENTNVQAGIRKGRGTRNQTANICWVIEKAKEFQKSIYFCVIDYAKLFDSVDHHKQQKMLKEMKIPDHPPSSWETCMQVEKQQLEPDMEEWTSSKLGKEYDKDLTSMQSTSC